MIRNFFVATEYGLDSLEDIEEVFLWDWRLVGCLIFFVLIALIVILKLSL